MPAFVSLDDIRVARVEHTACLGTCPVYSYSFWVDGRAEYHGEAFVPRIGHYKGKIGGGEFRALAYLIVTRGFGELEDRYTTGWTCQPSVITTVTAGSWTKRVEAEGNAGPDSLVIIELSLDLACTRVNWRKARTRQGAT